MRYFFVFGILAFLLALPTAYRYIQFSSSTKINDSEVIKVTSYNSMLFDLYNWWHDKETRPKLFTNLKNINSDILCLQEFYTSEEKGDYDNIDTVMTKLNFSYFHAEYTETLRDFDHWGIATFSKFPIINKEAKHFAKRGGNIFISSDIKIGDDTIRVINTHLESIHFGWSDYKFIQNFNNDDVDQDELKGSLNIIRRLRKAFIKRATQVEVLHDSIAVSPYPIIVCGDFNDTPSSYTYAILAENLKDALEKVESVPEKLIRVLFHRSGLIISFMIKVLALLLTEL